LMVNDCAEISDSGVKPLLELPSLGFLTVLGCAKVSEKFQKSIASTLRNKRHAQKLASLDDADAEEKGK
jgi:hypothetical protein